MFIRCGDVIVNTDNVVAVLVTEPRDGALITVDIVTTAPSSVDMGSGGDIVAPGPYEIWLTGEAAEKFLTALPVYEPVLESEEP